MSNYNSQLQSNNTDLQTVLQTLQTKAAGGEQATPVISVSSNGLITATAGTKTSTHQLAFQAAKTITPSTASQIAVSSGYFTGGSVMVKGDANLVAGNIKSGVSIFGVNGTLQEGSGSGEAAEWSENEDAIISKTIRTYTNDRVTSIGSYVFQSCNALTSVNFPAAKSISPYAFYSCRSLTSANFPVATSIGSYAFAYCSSLTSVSFPVAKSMSTFAFYGCRSLTSVSFPVATFIGSNAFASCSSLTSVSFPVATTIDSNAFYNCNSLTSVSFPVATFIGRNAFSSCSSLTSVSFPVATTIGSNAFANCYNLKSLYLTDSRVCTLSNSNAFTSTPIGGYSTSAGTYGSIYVPASLLTSYQTATNWTYFSSRFAAVENCEDWDGTYGNQGGGAGY